MSSSANTRARRRAAGLCIDCGLKPAESRCRACLDRHRGHDWVVEYRRIKTDWSFG